ncbi:MAG: hypothetical protein A3D28_00640 [Omnitrophica bacterium RIFCSPHIGHO2_02_FULL_63_14]|nr:MAG: hypothetical protein A3D28_00640 [Omnitrophica bacterium RIFCSPHIGHO2_02_FULL_63_14]
MLTSGRAVHDSAIERIKAARPGTDALKYHDTAGRLLLGATVVAKAQTEALSEPRRFVIFREVSPPWRRLFLLIPGLAGCLAGLLLFFKKEPA